MTDKVNSIIATEQYPIGKFVYPLNYSLEDLTGWIKIIRHFPLTLKEQVTHLSELDLIKTYRTGGWNIRQLIHHCADSHINAYVRLKLALTENNPIIKTYHENSWAELPDTNLTPVGISLEILIGVHYRWSILLDHLEEQEWARSYTHPESGKITPVWAMTALYAWHSNHHLRHIQNALA